MDIISLEKMVEEQVFCDSQVSAGAEDCCIGLAGWVSRLVEP